MGYAFDPELAPALEMMPPFSIADLAAAREQFTAIMATVPADPRTDQLEITDRLIPGPEGAPAVPVRVYAPRESASPLPGVLYLHSGGFVFGSVEAEHVHAVTMALEAEVVVVSVEYRLAPEHPYPAAVDDSYAALRWMAEHSAELGVDPQRIAVSGTSAGGGLAAAVALVARDRGGPQIVFQLLDTPELDDRLQTPSMITYTDTPIWHRPNAVLSWDYYLGNDRDDVPCYAAPARATDVSGLPSAYISTAQFDPLRDEGLEYAGALLRAGVPTEVHNFPGTFHASSLTPFAVVSQRQVTEMHRVLRAALHG